MIGACGTTETQRDEKERSGKFSPPRPQRLCDEIIRIFRVLRSK